MVVVRDKNKMGELFCRSKMLTDDILSSQTGRSQRPAELLASRFLFIVMR